MKVTVGIKALNEERHIAAALESALKAVEPFGGEVVLADSGSTDRTIEIARTYPVRIVQLANPAERSCGAGAQLAFQYALGDFFYLLDGDMVLDPDFVKQGIAFLEANPKMAAVGGRVREMNTAAEEFQIRAKKLAEASHWKPGVVDRLDCGGLYRSQAVRDVDYFADRNLHAFEEFELAARLQARGWKLARIDCHAVDHYGHVSGGYKLMLRRIKSGYSGASGEVLRGAVGQAHLPVVLKRLGQIRNGSAVILWWCLILASIIAPVTITTKLIALLLLLVVPFTFLVIRRGSLNLGIFSMAAWNVTAWGLLSGFVRKRVSPRTPLAAVTLSETSRAA